MSKKKNVAITLLLSILVKAPDVPTDSEPSQTSTTTDQSSIENRHAQEQQRLDAQHQAELEALYQKQAQEKNDIFVKSNALTGTLDDQTLKNLKTNLDAHAQKSEKEEANLQAKQDQEKAELKAKQQKQVAQSKSWTNKISSLFSKDETGVDNVPKSPTSSTLSKKQKSWGDSFHETFGTSYKDDALKTLYQNPEGFVQDPDTLKKTLQDLTDNERQDVLNSWLGIWEEKCKNVKSRHETLISFYKSLETLNKNLYQVLPDDQRISLYKYNPDEITIGASELDIKTIKQSFIEPKSIRFSITETIPTLQKSSEPVVNNFQYVPAREGYEHGQKLIKNKETELLQLANQKAKLVNMLKNYDTSDRNIILNDWVKFWQDKYNNGDTLVKKNILGKVKDSSLQASNQEKESTAVNFIQGTQDMLKTVNEILPRNQKLVLVDNRGKLVNTTDLFHLLAMHEKAPSSKIDYIKEFNPSKFSFKIIQNN